MGVGSHEPQGSTGLRSLGQRAAEQRLHGRAAIAILEIMELSPAIGGAVAGACGTTALLGTDALARAVLGRRAVFAPSQIARRLLRERLGASISKREARHLGAVMRAGYGMALGALLVPRVARRLRSRVLGACALAAAITGLEVVMLPRLGATPRWSRWSAAEKLLLPLHTASFGLLALTAWRRLRT